MMYSLRSIRDKQPMTIALAVFAIVNFALAGFHVELDPAIRGLGETALVAVLGLFVNAKTTNTATLTEIGDTTDQAAQTAARETVKALRPRPLRAPTG